MKKTMSQSKSTRKKTCSNSGPSLSMIRRRVEEMERKWKKYGYPVSSPSPDAVQSVPRHLFSRIKALQLQWKIYFGEANVGASVLSAPGADAITQLTNMLTELELKWSTYFSQHGSKNGKKPNEAPIEREVSPVKSNSSDSDIEIIEFDINVAALDKLNLPVITISSSDEDELSTTSKTAKTAAVPPWSSSLAKNSDNNVKKKRSNPGDTGNGSAKNGKDKHVELPSCPKCYSYSYYNDFLFGKHLRSCFSYLTLEQKKRLYTCVKCSNQVEGTIYIDHFGRCRSKPRSQIAQPRQPNNVQIRPTLESRGIYPFTQSQPQQNVHSQPEPPHTHLQPGLQPQSNSHFQPQQQGYQLTQSYASQQLQPAPPVPQPHFQPQPPLTAVSPPYLYLQPQPPLPPVSQPYVYPQPPPPPVPEYFQPPSLIQSNIQPLSHCQPQPYFQLQPPVPQQLIQPQPSGNAWLGNPIESQPPPLPPTNPWLRSPNESLPPHSDLNPWLRSSNQLQASQPDFNPWLGISNECSFCGMRFPDQQSLASHKYWIHQVT